MTKGQSNVSHETWVEYSKLLNASLRELEEASGAHRAVVKKAKAAGVNPNAILAALRAKRKEETVIAQELRDYVRALHVNRVTISANDVYGGWETPAPTPEDDAYDAEQRGYQAGTGNGLREDNPFAAGSEQHAEWDRGWRKGQEALAKQLGDNAKAANPSRKRPERPPENKPQPAVGRKTGRAGKTPKGAVDEGVTWDEAPPVVN